MAEEAVECFQSLLASVPAWIAELEGILQAAKQRQHEYLFANQPAEEPTVLAKRKKSVSSSLKSKRSQHEVEAQDKVEPQAQEDNLLRPQLPHMTNSDALRLSQRKRKTASALSGGQSGPTKYRSRAMVVVYFDGQTQKQFEDLVRLVGSSRNSIRKGRMSAKLDSLTRTSTSSSCSSESSDGGEETIKGLGTFNFRTTRTRRVENSSLVGGNSDITDAYDKVDGVLEKAQSLVERAAHQILRDGDCSMELGKASTNFQEAKRLADAELPALRQKAEKAGERRRRYEERRKEPGDRFGDKDELIPKADMSTVFPNNGMLEVDDGEESSDEDNAFEVTSMGVIGNGKYQLRPKPRMTAS